MYPIRSQRSCYLLGIQLADAPNVADAQLVALGNCSFGYTHCTAVHLINVLLARAVGFVVMIEAALETVECYSLHAR